MENASVSAPIRRRATSEGALRAVYSLWWNTSMYPGCVADLRVKRRAKGSLQGFLDDTTRGADDREGTWDGSIVHRSVPRYAPAENAS